MRQFGKIVFDLQTQLGRQERKALKQPLHVRVGRLVAKKLRQLRIVARKLAPKPPKIVDLFAKLSSQRHVFPSPWHRGQTTRVYRS
ncbi:hypothetical protein D3C72_2278950 [compost metagenome]